MSKLGDYRYEPGRKRHTITVNHDLNPYAFLLTYIHEVAHMDVQLKYGRKVRPHGLEWKRSFQQLMLPVLNKEVFPEKLLAVLSRHMQKPKASSASDPVLTQALRDFDQRPKDQFLLADLPLQEVFQFRKRIFRKDSRKRSRALCTELASGRKYLIPEIAEVRLVNTEMEKEVN